MLYGAGDGCTRFDAQEWPAGASAQQAAVAGGRVAGLETSPSGRQVLIVTGVTTPHGWYGLMVLKAW